MSIEVKRTEPTRLPPIESVKVTCAVDDRDLFEVYEVDNDNIYVRTRRSDRRGASQGLSVGISRKDWNDLVFTLGPWARGEKNA